MQIIATAPDAVNLTAPIPQSGPIAAPAPLGDPGALSTLRELDVVRDGRLDQRDVAALGARVAHGPSGTASSGADAWKWNQARMLTAYGTTAPDATVRGLLHLTHTAAPGDQAGGSATHGNLSAHDVLAGVRALDTSALRSAGVPLVATFDYDDTLGHGDVFIPAMAALAARKQFRPEGDPAVRAALAAANVPAELIDRGDVNDRARLLTRLIVPSGTPLPIPGAKPVAVPDAFFAFGDALRGMDAAAAARTMADAFATGVPDAGIAPLRTTLIDGPAAHGDSARELVDGVRAAGIDPWIVSWGFDFIVRAAAPYAGVAVDHVLGSAMRIGADGRFAGLQTTTATPKSEMIRDAIGVPPVLAFGNSGSDLPMLDAAAGPTFLVRPEAQPSPLTSAVAARAGRTFGMDYALPARP